MTSDRVKLRETVETRLWRRVWKTDTCWVWLGHCNRGGYGRIHVTRDLCRQAHRVSWEHVNGPVPVGLQLDHLCKNPACVRPDHLEPVTPRENTLRSASASAMNAQKTRCSRGHEFSEHGRTIKVGAARSQRRCRRCEAINSARYRRSKHAF